MGNKICSKCSYHFWNTGKCNRLVVNGGFGNNDKVAKDYMKDPSKCDYFLEGEPKKDWNTGQFWNS